MANPKYDGVIEAARYKPNGELEWVRAYLRRGPTWSDWVLIDRQSLIKRLKAGKRFMAGDRVPQMAGTFEVTQPVKVIQRDGKEVLVTGDLQSEQDRLEGVPVL